MSRDFPRSRRIEDQILRILNDITRADIRDPRLRGAMITAVKVSRDLGVAWVYFTALNPEHDRDELEAAFVSAGRFLRKRLAAELTVRHVPELRFRYDDLAESTRAMDELIDEAVSKDRQQSAAADGDEQ
jgi:ribosome-binding factor A